MDEVELQVGGLYKDVKEALEMLYYNLEIAADQLNAAGNVQGERSLLEQTIQSSTNYLVQMKTRVNRLVPINKLPVELFTKIILLAYLPTEQYKHSYISYTWVCRHWQLILIQTPIFWTYVRNPTQLQVGSFDNELLDRSKTAALDVKTVDCIGFQTISESFLAKESYRIRNLWVHGRDNETRSVFSGKRFPSLRGLVYDEHFYTPQFITFLPDLATFHHLETFQGNLECDYDTFMAAGDQVAAVFSRLRTLNLRVSDQILQPVLDILHNSIKLQDLQLKTDNESEFTNTSRHVNFPALEFLSINNALIMEHFQVPKLSSLDITCHSLAAFDIAQQALAKFDVSSIRYLYILNPSSSYYSQTHSILGSKRPEHLESSTKFNEYLIVDRLGYYGPFYSPQDIYSIHDPLSNPRPRNCFELKFYFQDLFIVALRQLIFSVFPRLTRIRELYIFPSAIVDSGIQLEEIITSLPPTIENVFVTKGDKLVDFFSLSLDDPRN